MKYDVTIRTDKDGVAIILGALTDKHHILQSVVPVQEQVREQRRSSKRKIPGDRGVDLVMRTLSAENRVFSYGDIAREFVAHGYQAKSASPALSTLVSKGKVRRVGNGLFALPGTVVKLGAG